MDLANSEYMGPADPEMAAAFWEASRQRLSVSLATAQQGVEFILRSRIAEISPFLLIGSLPLDWPRKCDQQDTQFADFRTIAAQDLLRVHDAVAPAWLGPDFLAKFEELRKTRNAIMHTVDARVSPRAEDVVRDHSCRVSSLLSGRQLVCPAPVVLGTLASCRALLRRLRG